MDTHDPDFKYFDESCASKFANTIDAQLQASFFSILHDDARRLIYREVLGYNYYALCLGTQLKHGVKQYVQIWRGLPLLNTRDFKAKKYDTTGTATICEDRKSKLIPLMLICRRLYVDLIHMIFRHFMFRFSDVNSFLRFTYIVPKFHFQKIQHLQLDFLLENYSQPRNRFGVGVLGTDQEWNDTQSIIRGSMPDLKSLQIKFTKEIHDIQTEVSILKPLLDMESSKTLHVYIDFTDKEAFEESGRQATLLIGCAEAYRGCTNNKSSEPVNEETFSERKAIFFRHRLQKEMLSSVKTVDPKSLPEVVRMLSILEASAQEMRAADINTSKIHKVLRAISILDSIPMDHEYQIRRRCEAILNIWYTIGKLAKPFLYAQ